MKQFDVIIIGAGAAGLMCAIETGKRGRQVLVVDHANKAGKKILMSGGGRCNFTNRRVSHENFISHNRHFCRSALSRYTPEDFISLVEKHKIAYQEKTLGQLFCSNKSKDIVTMLLSECKQVGVSILLDCSIEEVSQQSDQHFTLIGSAGKLVCQSLVVATGGLSIPTMGASPFGYRLAEQFGIKVWPTRAALVPFTLHVQDKERLASLAGVSVECVVSCARRDFREAMLLTHRGLSGPAMLQISSYWQAGDTLLVDLLPDHDLLTELQQLKQQQPNKHLKTVLNQYLPKRLVSVWLDEALGSQTLQQCSHQQLRAVTESFKHWQIKPNGTEGYRTAEVTLGGVDCGALSSKTFEVRSVPGLYFIGEVLDVTGWLGGYNFQWAWASGAAAGRVV